MINFGRQALTPGTPVDYNTGVGWEYLQILNESPYLLGLNFSGLGSIDFPISHREDIWLSPRYTGSLVITPSNYGFSGPFVSAAPSTFVSVNGFGPGELAHPQSVALARINNIGNPLNIAGGVASSIVNTGNPRGTSVIQATPTGDAQSPLSMLNDGTVAIGDATNAGSLSVVGPSTFTGQIQGDGTNRLNLDGKGQSIEFLNNGTLEAAFNGTELVMSVPIGWTGTNGLQDVPVQSGTVHSQGTASLFLDTQNTSAEIDLRNNGTNVIRVGNTGIDIEQPITVNGFSTTIIDPISNVNNLVLNCRGAAGNINFQHAGVQDFHSGPGLWLDSGQLHLLAGAFSRIAWGTATATNSGVTITHGLGATPGTIHCQVEAGTGNTGAIVAYVTSIGSTTFVLSTNSTSSFTIMWMAMA